MPLPRWGNSTPTPRGHLRAEAGGAGGIEKVAAAPRLYRPTLMRRFPQNRNLDWVADPATARTYDCGISPHEPRSSGRESAPSGPGGKFEPTHVGCYGSSDQSVNLRWENSLHEPSNSCLQPFVAYATKGCPTGSEVQSAKPGSGNSLPGGEDTGAGGQRTLLVSRPPSPRPSPQGEGETRLASRAAGHYPVGVSREVVTNCCQLNPRAHQPVTNRHRLNPARRTRQPVTNCHRLQRPQTPGNLIPPP